MEVVNSQQTKDLYHFKVLELRTHEDTESYSQCKVRFHFIFGLIKKQMLSNHYQFDWDISSDPQQRLYLSRDTMRMMEVINGFIATVYSRVNI